MATNDSPRVSVVLAVYNGLPYIDAAMRSILAQTYPDFELIVVDDRSSDGTLDRLETFGRADHRVIVLANSKNQGQSAALNRGLREARGEYIARHDGDDTSSPERLSEQVAFLDANRKVGLAATQSQWIDEHDRPLKIWEQPTENRDIQHTMLSYCCLIHGSVMFRRECIARVGMYDADIRVANDHELWLRMVEAYDVASLPRPLYNYRVHGGMISSVHNELGNRESRTAREQAIARRLRSGRNYISGDRSASPAWMIELADGALAERYYWWSRGTLLGHWSQGATAKDVRAAFQLWAIAFRLYPAGRQAAKGLWAIVRTAGRLAAARAPNRTRPIAEK